jgi:hypothetical protein
MTTCRKKEEPKDQIVKEFVDTLITQEETTHHVDTNYQYEFRKGEHGNYTYNYDVSGTDTQGNEVTGNITIEGKYGTGFITNSEGKELEVDVEWINKGILKAIDEDGEEYELQVN